jgi:hypothetical protein
MRLFTLISVLSVLPLALAAERAPSPPPPGAIRLPDGFRHEQFAGKDSTPGRIWKQGGLEIKYDIGKMAGNHAGAVKEPDRSWAVSQVVSGQPVEIVKGRDGVLVATFTRDMANFYAKVSGEQDVAAFLAIVLTYPPAPAAG